MDIKVKVTYHAVQQYRDRMFATIGDEEINKILKTAAIKGKFESLRPGGAYSMTHNGIKIVVIDEGNKRTVVTCLGNKTYSAWSQKNDILPRYRRRVAV